jgi:flagellar FliL protein
MADEKTEEKEEKEEGKRKLPVKWIIVAFLTLVLVGGGGVVGWKFLAGNGEEVSPEMGNLKPALGTIFPLDTFIVNVAETNGERYLKTTLEVELKDGSLAGEVEKRMPQVRDSILLLLSTKRFEDIKSFQGKSKLRNEIITRLNGLLYAGAVQKVYFTEFVVQ